MGTATVTGWAPPPLQVAGRLRAPGPLPAEAMRLVRAPLGDGVGPPRVPGEFVRG